MNCVSEPHGFVTDMAKCNKKTYTIFPQGKQVPQVYGTSTMIILLHCTHAVDRKSGPWTDGNLSAQFWGKCIHFFFRFRRANLY